MVDQTTKTSVYKTEELWTAFQIYYSQQYSGPQLEKEQQVIKFLYSLNLPTLMEEQNN